MSRYIDEDKLIAEIERLLKCTERHRGEAVADGSRQTLYWIKDFITSLQQEQPEVEKEKEIDEWLKTGHITDTRYSDYCDDDIKETARHFYELGLKARK